MDFIFKILEDAYNSGMNYDVTDLRPKVLAFANNSSHQAEYCVKLVSKMHFKSENSSEAKEAEDPKIIFYDVEVFPNLFVVVWKAKDDNHIVKMINPTPTEIEELVKFNLVGFKAPIGFDKSR